MLSGHCTSSTSKRFKPLRGERSSGKYSYSYGRSEILITTVPGM